MAFIVFILLSAIWGSSFLFLRLAIEDFGPFLLADLRVFFALLSLLPFLFIFKSKKNPKINLYFFLLLGCLNSAVPFVLFGFAAQDLPSGYLAVINSFVPVWSLFFSYLVLGEKIKFRTFFSASLGILGVMIVVGFGPVTLSLKNIFAIIMAFVATFCYAISGVLTKKYCKNFSEISLSVFCLASATLILIPFTFIDLPTLKFSLLGLVSIIFLGIVCSGVAMMLYFNLIKSVGPVKATTVTFVVPAFGTLWGTIFLNEVFTIYMGIGIFLILMASIAIFFENR